MKHFIANEIRNRCTQIREKGVTEDGVDRLIHAYEQAYRINKVTRNEGLLEVMEDAAKLASGSMTDRFFGWLIGKVSDSVDSRIIEQLGIDKAAALDLPDYDGLILMFYIKAALWIQAGFHPIEMQNVFLSVCPDFIDQEIRKRGIIEPYDDLLDPHPVNILLGNVAEQSR